MNSEKNQLNQEIEDIRGDCKQVDHKLHKYQQIFLQLENCYRELSKEDDKNPILDTTNMLEDLPTKITLKKKTVILDKCNLITNSDIKNLNKESNNIREKMTKLDLDLDSELVEIQNTINMYKDTSLGRLPNMSKSNSRNNSPKTFRINQHRDTADNNDYEDYNSSTIMPSIDSTSYHIKKLNNYKKIIASGGLSAHKNQYYRSQLDDNNRKISPQNRNFEKKMKEKYG